MDIRLHEAARTGNIDNLYRLLIENPLLLSTNTLFSVQNPLHIATLSGQVDFAKEIIRLRPEFVKEVSQDGFRPMDMAAANGHVEIVKEMMKMDRELCRVEGRDGRTGLHYATMKGKVDVIKVMVLGCVECLDDVNVGKESVVHVGVKNNQFEAVKALVDLVRDVKRDGVLNMKDEHGNTVLHLATWMKQRKVIELLLLEDRTPNSNPLEVNAINHTRITAMDLLHIFPSEAGDREIEEILRVSGAMKSKEITSSDPPPPPPSESDNPAMSNTAVRSERRRQQAKTNDLIEYFKFKNGRDSPSEARGALLIIAVLVATVTFQVGLSPPGGTWQDNFPGQTNNIGSIGGKEHYAGISIISSSSAIAFSLFVLFNSIGFTLSAEMIIILTSKFPLQFELQLCLLAMFLSYNTAIISIAPDEIKVYITLITFVLAVLITLLTKRIKLILKVMADLVRYMILKVIEMVGK